MSHQIDFTSMGATPEWNGHLRYSEHVWRRMAGRRPFYAVQERCSRHVELLRKHGFDRIGVMRRLRYDGLPRSALAAQWRTLPLEDLNCGAAYIVARKPTSVTPARP
jgi:hypothetical protein